MAARPRLDQPRFSVIHQHLNLWEHSTALGGAAGLWMAAVRSGGKPRTTPTLRRVKEGRIHRRVRTRHPTYWNTYIYNTYIYIIYNIYIYVYIYIYISYTPKNENRLDSSINRHRWIVIAGIILVLVLVPSFSSPLGEQPAPNDPKRKKMSHWGTEVVTKKRVIGHNSV